MSTKRNRERGSLEHETLNLRVVGSSPTLGVIYFGLQCQVEGEWSAFASRDMSSTCLVSECTVTTVPLPFCFMGATHADAARFLLLLLLQSGVSTCTTKHFLSLDLAWDEKQAETAAPLRTHTARALTGSKATDISAFAHTITIFLFILMLSSCWRAM